MRRLIILKNKNIFLYTALILISINIGTLVMKLTESLSLGNVWIPRLIGIIGSLLFGGFIGLIFCLAMKKKF